MYQAGIVPKDGQQDVEPKMHAEADFKKDTYRGNEDGEDCS